MNEKAPNKKVGENMAPRYYFTGPNPSRNCHTKRPRLIEVPLSPYNDR